ncbi:hypothetical protein B0H12DRAFT_1103550 [Mycena haematopus]|nr:hypothetical protein B0H12DRAFT_1103550 [Mycena haematopus]
MDSSLQIQSGVIGENPYPQTHMIQTLPPEILSEIFLNVLPAYPKCPGPSSLLLLCAICRKWRAVAISTPELWRAIQIIGSNKLRKLTAQSELLQIWLSRSGSCPLSLNLSIHPLTENPSIDSQLFQLAVLCSERWEHVDLFLTFEDLRILQGNMPLLRQLTFGFHQSIPSAATPANLFDCAPRLTDVVLTWNFEKWAINLPWHQLTRLHAYFLQLEECAEILRDAVNLVYCRVGICSTADPTAIPTLPVHRHLSHLILRLADDYNSSLSLSPLFNNLTTPALLTLQVYEPGITVHSLGEFISRSHCNLQELHIDEASIPESTYREAFPFVKTVVNDFNTAFSPAIP